MCHVICPVKSSVTWHNVSIAKRHPQGEMRITNNEQSKPQHKRRPLRGSTSLAWCIPFMATDWHHFTGFIQLRHPDYHPTGYHYQSFSLDTNRYPDRFSGSILSDCLRICLGAVLLPPQLVCRVVEPDATGTCCVLPSDSDCPVIDCTAVSSGNQYLVSRTVIGGFLWSRGVRRRTSDTN